MWVLSSVFHNIIVDVLKHYNSDLTGYSTGTGFRNSDNARLNVAEDGHASGYVSWYTSWCYDVLYKEHTAVRQICNISLDRFDERFNQAADQL